MASARRLAPRITGQGSGHQPGCRPGRDAAGFAAPDCVVMVVPGKSDAAGAEADVEAAVLSDALAAGFDVALAFVDGLVVALGAGVTSTV
jgi:hypothetical protein